MTQLNLETHFKATNFCSIDLETTGLNSTEDKIIEVGMVFFDSSGTNETYQKYVNPGSKIPRRIKQLTGISDNDVSEAPTISDISIEIENLLKDSILVGHNIRFDIDFLRQAGIHVEDRYLDTLDLAYVVEPSISDYSLSSLGPLLGLTKRKSHNALDDSETTRELFIHIMSRLKELPTGTIAQIKELSIRGKWDVDLLLDYILKDKLSHQVIKRSPPPISEKDPTTLRHTEPNNFTQDENTDSDLEPLFQKGGPLSESIASFEERAEQIEMAQLVKDNISKGENLVVEAGTGVGKSIAYLIPSIQYAKQTDNRVIISTNTINLQDQLFNKDMPLALDVLDITDREIPYCVLKGRSNYLCLRRFQNLLQAPNIDTSVAILCAKILVWLAKTTTGDVSELNISRRSHTQLWRRLNAESSDNCMEHGEECFLRSARETAANSKIIIINHSLLFADLIAERALLPPYKSLIIDEAHHIEEQATSSFGREISDQYIRDLCNRIDGDNSLPTLSDTILRDITDDEPNLRAMSTIKIAASNFSHDLKTTTSNIIATLLEATLDQTKITGKYGGDFTHRILDAHRDISQDTINSLCDKLYTDISKFNQLIERSLIVLQGYDDTSRVANLLTEYQDLRLDLIELSSRLRELVLEPSDQSVYWIEKSFDGRDKKLRSAPINVGPLLTDHLYKSTDSIVMTSATLSTNKTFDYLIKTTNFSPDTEAILGSPFNYHNSSLLIIPTDVPTPQSENYMEYVTTNIIQSATAAGGRTMALFTSHSAVRQAFNLLNQKMQDSNIAVLAQGLSGPPGRLLRRFKQHPATILLGTSSFWEGVDLKGEALQVLIIARLPFDVPTDPIFEARSEQYEKPFYDYSIPRAMIKFKQGFGRLIRSHSDRGVALILDSRIHSSNYGRRFVQCLPEMNVQQTLTSKTGDIVGTWLGTQ